MKNPKQADECSANEAKNDMIPLPFFSTEIFDIVFINNMI